MFKFSKKWQSTIAVLESYGKHDTWEDIIDFYIDRPDERKIDILGQSKEGRITILSEGVWAKISKIGFRKIKAFSDNTVFYDGTYNGLYDAYQIGSINYEFVIDDSAIDISPILYGKQRKALADFIAKKTGITDVALPKVPNGILKFPTDFQIGQEP